MTTGVLSADRLERYADAIVRSCVGLVPGDRLFVQGQPAHREIMAAVAAAGYRAGASYVEFDYTDGLLTAARVRHAPDEHLGPVAEWTKKRFRAQIQPDAATVTITGEGDPGIFDGLPAERLARDQQIAHEEIGWFLRAVKGDRRRWAGVAWPTPHWASQVYPELEVESAQRRLAEDILWFCRLGPDDPPGFEGWETHVDAIAGRAAALTDLRLERLELRGPGTRLDVGLAPNTRWLGGRDVNAHGKRVAANFPTEENFTSPDPRAAEGTFRCSRPLSFRGRLIDGIQGEIRAGEVVRIDAATDEDRDFLAAFLALDRGASRLGEVALVDAGSRIGQADRVYSNTLIDENAAAHIAFGFGFDQARLPSDGGARRHRVNASGLHLDVMIGTDDFEATGVAAGGRRVPLVVDGEWQIG